MSIYALGDLHLSLGEGINKPMDIYGEQWVRHAERLKANWLKQVSIKDTVILAGDISWALKFNEAKTDLEWLHSLPGKKVVIKGNHDLWWTGINKMNAIYDDMIFLHNFCVTAEDTAICGSRGWTCPGTDGFTEADNKIYQRELLRVQRSIDDAKTKGIQNIIGVLHFPPTNDKLQASGFTELFTNAGVKLVVYGHLHGSETYHKGLQGNFNGVEYKLVSLDYLNCNPYLIKTGGDENDQ
jgi:uncharacterized protein